MNSCSRRLMPLLFGAFLLVFVLPDEAQACSCLFGGPAPCYAYWKTDAVFAGTVVGSTKVKVSDGNYEYERRLVRFAVTEPFRGIQSLQAEVITGWGGGDCGYAFQDGEAYLVYAHRDGQGERLHTSICTRTRPLAQAAEDLAYIRGLPSADAGAFIFGRVSKRNHRPKEGETALQPVSSAELTVEGEATRVEARTDAQGAYRVAGLAPGTYKVRLKVPKGLTREGVGEDLVLEGKAEVVARGCVEASFYLESDTRISGRVLDAAGQPVAQMRVQIRGAPSDPSNINTFLRAQTDAEGRFEFKTVPPGDYLLGIRILSWSSEEALPYPRTYYPGVGLKAQASVISVREGEHLSDVELRLPPRLTEYSVPGLVVWSDGRPAPGVNIYLALLEEGESSINTSLQADGLGRFTLKVYEGLSYKVSAYPRGATGAEAQSKWVEVPQAPGAAPVKLVLPVLKN